MTDNTEKIRTVREAIELLKVRVSDFERAIADEKAEQYLKKAKALDYIHSYKGDKNYKEK